MSEHAEYNVCTNRFYWWPTARLPEDEYRKVKALGFQWWPRGCFTALWSPAAEDYLTDLGLEITEDDGLYVLRVEFHVPLQAKDVYDY